MSSQQSGQQIGTRPPTIPPQVAEILMFIERYVADALKPLEERVHLLRREVDVLKGDVISNIVRSSMSGAYHAIKQEMTQSLTEVIQNQVRANKQMVNDILAAVGEVQAAATSKIDDKMFANIEATLLEIEKRLQTLEKQSADASKIDLQAFAEKISDNIGKEVKKELDKVVDKVDEISRLIEKLESPIQRLTFAAERVAKAMETTQTEQLEALEEEEEQE